MKKIIYIIVFVFICFANGFAQIGTISNIEVTKRSDGSGMFDIYFDLSGQSRTYNVSVEILFSGETVYSPINKGYLQGDLDQIAPGVKKHIEWNGLGSFPDKYSPNTKLKILATGTIDNGVTDSFTDTRDGKTYKTIKIGNQVWFAENLAYLPSVSPPTSGSSSSPYYYVYNYSGTDVAAAKATSNYSTYGVLYNWEAAKVSCPPGWHLPSDAEWKQLEMALGMTQAQSDGEGFRGIDQGTQMKAISQWYNDGNGTNASGFSALPGGYRYIDNTINDIGRYGKWWSSTEYSTINARSRLLYFNSGGSYRGYDGKMDGFSVRCIKDNEKIGRAHV